jgi:hypothetical protein
VVSGLFTPLAEALDQLDRLKEFQAHVSADHHDPIARYTEAATSLVAFVVAVYMLLSRVDREHR